MLEMAFLTKLLAKSGIDLKAVMKESQKIPKLLEILAKQSNAQTKVLISIQERLDWIEKKLDWIERKLEEKP